ncbi:MAG: hypothetical protein K1X66_05990 [Verrucomicrobiae bacterium]|nr:hypothetical protein [Verrucomicrobiae bacterium]
MKKIIFTLSLFALLFIPKITQAGVSFNVSFGSYYPSGYYYDHCRPAYRTYYNSYYARPVYYRPAYPNYGYSGAYRQGFRDGYSTAVRRAVPVYRVERCDRVYR